MCHSVAKQGVRAAFAYTRATGGAIDLSHGLPALALNEAGDESARPGPIELSPSCLTSGSVAGGSWCG